MNHLTALAAVKMDQEKLFSMLANQKLRATLVVDARRREVMVELPGKFSTTVNRPRGKVEDWLIPLVSKTLKNHGYNWDNKGWDMTASYHRTPHGYWVDVWCPKK